ncbi:MAG: hypothetical protein ACLT9P_06645 [Evtepia gabavorous]
MGWRLWRFLAAGDQGEQEKNGKQEGCNGFHTWYSFRSAPPRLNVLVKDSAVVE